MALSKSQWSHCLLSLTKELYSCTTVTCAYREWSFGHDSQLRDNCVVCQSSGLILNHCLPTVNPQMQDCGTLSWVCNLGRSLVVNLYSQQSPDWTESSWDWEILAEIEAAFLRQTQAVLTAFHLREEIPAGSLPMLRLGNCRLQLKKERNPVD